jgi:hypothetical protein
MLSKFSKGLIYDTRPKLLAQTSRGKGKIKQENIGEIKNFNPFLLKVADAKAKCIIPSGNILTGTCPEFGNCTNHWPD